MNLLNYLLSIMLKYQSLHINWVWDLLFCFIVFSYPFLAIATLKFLIAPFLYLVIFDLFMKFILNI
jgi:hypothetical protein